MTDSCVYVVKCLKGYCWYSFYHYQRCPSMNAGLTVHFFFAFIEDIKAAFFLYSIIIRTKEWRYAVILCNIFMSFSFCLCVFVTYCFSPIEVKCMSDLCLTHNEQLFSYIVRTSYNFSAISWEPVTIFQLYRENQLQLFSYIVRTSYNCSAISWEPVTIVQLYRENKLQLFSYIVRTSYNCSAISREQVTIVQLYRENKLQLFSYIVRTSYNFSAISWE